MTILTQIREVSFVQVEVQHNKCVLMETHTQVSLSFGQVKNTHGICTWGEELLMVQQQHFTHG